MIEYNDGMIVYYEHNTATWFKIIEENDIIKNWKFIHKPLNPVNRRGGE